MNENTDEQSEQSNYLKRTLKMTDPKRDDFAQSVTKSQDLNCMTDPKNDITPEAKALLEKISRHCWGLDHDAVIKLLAYRHGEELVASITGNKVFRSQESRYLARWGIRIIGIPLVLIAGNLMYQLYQQKPITWSTFLPLQSETHQLNTTQPNEAPLNTTQPNEVPLSTTQPNEAPLNNTL